MWSILPSARLRSALHAGGKPPPAPDATGRPRPATLAGPLLIVLAAVILIMGATLIDFLVAQAAFARPHRHHGGPRPASFRHQTQQRTHNDAAVMILGGRPGATAFDIAHDLAAAVAAGDGLRLIPLDAAGGIDSLRDLLLLRGVDLALVPGNVLGDAGTAEALPGLRDRVAYVTVLYGEELHILAGPGVAAVENLSGRTIAVPPDDAGAEQAVRDLMRRLGVKVVVVRVAAADAIDDVRSGALGALVMTGGKPMRFVAGLPKDGVVHLLALPPQASDQAAEGGYSPGRFDADDYPALIPGGQTIDTVSVSAVLVARSTEPSEDSHRRVAKFVPAFFGALSDLAGPRWHPKWREVNLAATLGGWTRFPAAAEWLDKAMREQSVSVQREFDEFLRVNSPAGAPPLSAAARRQLFEQYLTWTRRATQMPR